MLVSDHPHLFETGGENYHTDFTGWDYVRGHEGDPWRTHPDPSWVGTPAPPARDGGWFWRQALGPGVDIDRAYDRSRTYFRAEDDYPGPAHDGRRRGLAARRRAATTTGSCCSSTSSTPTSRSTRPTRGLGRYDDEPWDDDLVIWPPYVVGGGRQGPAQRAPRPGTSGPTTEPSCR